MFIFNKTDRNCFQHVSYKSKTLLGGIFSLLIVWLIDEYVDTVSTVHDNVFHWRLHLCKFCDLKLLWQTVYWQSMIFVIPFFCKIVFRKQWLWLLKIKGYLLVATSYNPTSRMDNPETQLKEHYLQVTCRTKTKKKKTQRKFNKMRNTVKRTTTEDEPRCLLILRCLRWVKPRMNPGVYSSSGVYDG